MTMPAMCPDHRAVYATRVKVLRAAVHRPGAAKALARQATDIARQCLLCPNPEERR